LNNGLISPEKNRKNRSNLRKSIDLNNTDAREYPINPSKTGPRIYMPKYCVCSKGR
jgi:hypothetical protein